ncbi:MAG: hypothetical protein EZS28_049720 [Streblomastix strix]|uniref:Uncharacterized protein n=1 Tax=Streblomastix strix TaxID=222440 RepID=A0A5J4T8Q4_9EUKA|nr:MAG: hypothetical protein EZS28_049720 [Streblomastix strix]
MIVAHQLQEGAQIGGYTYDEDEMQFSELRDLTRICLYDGYASIKKSQSVYSTIMPRLEIGIDIRDIQRCWKDGCIKT